MVGTEDDEGRYGAIKIDANAVLIAMTPTLAAELITARAKMEAADIFATHVRSLIITLKHLGMGNTATCVALEGFVAAFEASQ